MIRVSAWPASSSALRIAPIRPSIMSEGAITSQPAAAWTSAWRTRTVERGVVEHRAVVVDQAVVTVAGVGVERDVADHPELGQRRLDRPHRPADQVVRVGGFGAIEGLQRLGRDREQRHRRNAELRRLVQHARQQVDREPLDSRHRGHRLAAPLALHHEHRPDQIGDVEPVLGDQTA